MIGEERVVWLIAVWLIAVSNNPLLARPA